MVNFMCQVDWTVGWQLLVILLGVFVSVLLEETNI